MTQFASDHVTTKKSSPMFLVLYKLFRASKSSLKTHQASRDRLVCVLVLRSRFWMWKRPMSRARGGSALSPAPHRPLRRVHCLTYAMGGAARRSPPPVGENFQLQPPFSLGSSHAQALKSSNLGFKPNSLKFFISIDLVSTGTQGYSVIDWSQQVHKVIQ